MKVLSLAQLRETEREVQCPRGGFTSIRFLLESDGMGFTITHTTIHPGAGRQLWHYLHHLEACYCIVGTGILENEESGERWTIRPGMLYALDSHDLHAFTALEEVQLLCVFNPPLKGRETHREDGSYAP